MSSPVPELEALLAGELSPAQRLQLGHYLLGGDELTTVALVNLALERTAEEDGEDPMVAFAIRAVNRLVLRWRNKPAAGWDEDTRLGATLLAARLYRRKDSPGGMADFGTDSAAYVSGNWPDVAMLLGIGTYAVGRVG